VCEYFIRDMLEVKTSSCLFLCLPPFLLLLLLLLLLLPTLFFSLHNKRTPSFPSSLPFSSNPPTLPSSLPSFLLTLGMSCMGALACRRRKRTTLSKAAFSTVGRVRVRSSSSSEGKGGGRKERKHWRKMGGKGAHVATGEGEATYNTACGMIDTTILTACHRAALDHWQIEKRQGQSLQTRQHTHTHTTQDIFSRLLALLPPLLLSTLPSPHSLTTILLLVVEHASQEARGQEQGRVHWGVEFLPVFQDDADDAHPVFVCMQQRWVGVT